MIISASYKTDIPAFYGRWFRNRLDAGYCKMVNPYNRAQISTISLLPQDVDGFVFWTKDAGPFLDPLDEIARRGFPFIVQYAINGYPRALESRVVDAARAVQHMKRIHDQHGPGVGVWRYDTILFTSLTDPDFHLRNFQRLARQLEGSTDEVVVSFAQVYKKTRINTDAAASRHGFEWWDPPDETKRALLQDLCAIAQSHDMRLTVCSQPHLLVEGAAEARCIDAERISQVGGRFVKARLKGARKQCGCYYSRDIGDYDTCPHGCVYCYAVRSREIALERFRQHDPDGEFLSAVGGKR
ncbi:MAG: DUF1848 domain-containing protein [Oligoflexia bacterium]|nr:DUF1848 domain-containing protein [Oligoflexia bacterium]